MQLKRAADPADNAAMAAWFAKVINALGSTSASKDSVHATLAELQRSRLRLALETAAGDGRATVMSTVIEMLGADEIIISQPSVGGLTHPLAFGEPLRMSFVLNGKHHVGECRCLGRAKVPAGDGHPEHLLFAYRLSTPERLLIEERRGEPRVSIGLAGQVEAQLYSPGLDGPVLGTLRDISMSGASIETSLALGRIHPGQEVYLKCMLPDPVGLIDEVVDVVRIEVDAMQQRQVIAISLRRLIPGLRNFIQAGVGPVTVIRRRSA